MPEELKIILNKLMSLPAETEWLEFKEAKTNYDFNKLGKYFSALCNEANLKSKECGWLIFGVKNKPREIIGTNFRPNIASLDSLKAEIAKKTTNRITFIEIYELALPEGRVIMFKIPSAPKGIPVAWEGHYYGRDGESLVPLNIQEIEYIRNQLKQIDWSAQKDYELKGRINIVEKPDELVFTNVGSFLPGSVENVIAMDAPPERYRNQFLANAMVNLNMIDTNSSKNMVRQAVKI